MLVVGFAVEGDWFRERVFKEVAMQDRQVQGQRTGRKIQRLIDSRRAWQERCRRKQDEIRALRVRVRDLEISRDLWKRRTTSQGSVLGEEAARKHPRAKQA